MREVIEEWAVQRPGWNVGSHGHRYGVHQDGQLRLICNDAPTRGYTNIFVKDRTPRDLNKLLAEVNPWLVREDARYGGTTLHIPEDSVTAFLRALERLFGV